MPRDADGVGPRFQQSVDQVLQKRRKKEYSEYYVSAVPAGAVRRAYLSDRIKRPRSAGSERWAHRWPASLSCLPAPLLGRRIVRAINRIVSPSGSPRNRERACHARLSGQDRPRTTKPRACRRCLYAPRPRNWNFKREMIERRARCVRSERREHQRAPAAAGARPRPAGERNSPTFRNTAVAVACTTSNPRNSANRGLHHRREVVDPDADPGDVQHLRLHGCASSCSGTRSAGAIRTAKRRGAPGPDRHRCQGTGSGWCGSATTTIAVLRSSRAHGASPG